jgi:hypothetical protein
MSGSRLQQFKSIYIELLPIFVPSTTLFGFMIGLSANMSPRETRPTDSFMNVVGYTSIGIITGVFFPITYPFIGGYVLYKNR